MKTFPELFKKAFCVLVNQGEINLSVIRIISGVRRVERRRMKDVREEVGTKPCIVGKIAKSRMKWAGHMVRMKDHKLPKRSGTKKLEGCRK